MKLKIPFDELKDAIEQSSAEQHYFIDRKNSKIIFISEYENNFKEKIEELTGDNFILIPERRSDNDFDTMLLFVYSIKDFDIADKFEAVINGKKSFSHFKELLKQYPETEKKWFKYRDKEIKNETMNWLCKNNIELEDNNFMPKIEVRELKLNEVKLPEEFEGFGPIECMRCNNREGIKTKYFESSAVSENLLIEKEIKKIMKEKFGIESYGIIGGDDKEILTVSECPKCKSSEIFEDF